MYIILYIDSMKEKLKRIFKNCNFAKKQTSKDQKLRALENNQLTSTKTQNIEHCGKHGKENKNRWRIKLKGN